MRFVDVDQITPDNVGQLQPGVGLSYWRRDRQGGTALIAQWIVAAQGGYGTLLIVGRIRAERALFSQYYMRAAL
jgi:hypothetical protein